MLRFQGLRLAESRNDINPIRMKTMALESLRFAGRNEENKII